MKDNLGKCMMGIWAVTPCPGNSFLGASDFLLQDRTLQECSVLSYRFKRHYPGVGIRTRLVAYLALIRPSFQGNSL
jgi:hypothetical protein